VIEQLRRDFSQTPKATHGAIEEGIDDRVEIVPSPGHESIIATVSRPDINDQTAAVRNADPWNPRS
jgi:hypothetical protein